MCRTDGKTNISHESHANTRACTRVQVDIVIHSLANGPEVTKPLLETSRRGYLAASSASAYSMVSLVQKFAPIMPKGGSVVSLTYIASEKVGRVRCSCRLAFDRGGIWFQGWLRCWYPGAGR